MKIVVAGETFEVRQSAPGQFSYTWLSGPNPGYGFTSRLGYAAMDEPPLAAEDLHTTAIAEFLAAVDPATGFLE